MDVRHPGNPVSCFSFLFTTVIVIIIIIIIIIVMTVLDGTSLLIFSVLSTKRCSS